MWATQSRIIACDSFSGQLPWSRDNLLVTILHTEIMKRCALSCMDPYTFLWSSDLSDKRDRQTETERAGLSVCVCVCVCVCERERESVGVWVRKRTVFGLTNPTVSTLWEMKHSLLIPSFSWFG